MGKVTRKVPTVGKIPYGSKSSKAIEQMNILCYPESNRAQNRALQKENDALKKDLKDIRQKHKWVRTSVFQRAAELPLADRGSIMRK